MRRTLHHFPLPVAAFQWRCEMLNANSPARAALVTCAAGRPAARTGKRNGRANDGERQRQVRPSGLRKSQSRSSIPERRIVDPHHHLWRDEGDVYLLERVVGGHRLRAPGRKDRLCRVRLGISVRRPGASALHRGNGVCCRDSEPTVWRRTGTGRLQASLPSPISRAATGLPKRSTGMRKSRVTCSAVSAIARHMREHPGSSFRYRDGRRRA